MHKGQCGKVGVLGGCREYTGAPYYAGIAALKTGCDLSHIFCAESAATAIKAYSPELIVHPVLLTQKEIESSSENRGNMEAKIVEDVCTWFKALHVLIIGPGLGRDPAIMHSTKIIIQRAKDAKLPLVIDGDGLWCVQTDPNIIKGYPLAILTPNIAEYGRLCDVFNISKSETEEDQLQKLCKSFGNITIVMKGKVDLISDGTTTIKCEEEGSPRRCGGQGDILSGVIGVFMAWAHQHYSSGSITPSIPYPLLASYAGASLMRTSSREAFKKYRRSTTTPNMIEQIGTSFEALFSEDDSHVSKM